MWWRRRMARPSRLGRPPARSVCESAGGARSADRHVPWSASSDATRAHSGDVEPSAQARLIAIRMSEHPPGRRFAAYLAAFYVVRTFGVHVRRRQARPRGRYSVGGRGHLLGSRSLTRTRCPLAAASRPLRPRSSTWFGSGGWEGRAGFDQPGFRAHDLFEKHDAGREAQSPAPRCRREGNTVGPRKPYPIVEFASRAGLSVQEKAGRKPNFASRFCASSAPTARRACGNG